MTSERGQAHSFRDTLRRRVAPVALVAALAFLGMRTCAAEMASVQIELDLGAARSEVRALRVDMFRAGEDQSVLVFERSYGSAGVTTRPSFEASLDPGTYQLLIEVTFDGQRRRAERTVEVTDNAVIVLRLERELIPAG